MIKNHIQAHGFVLAAALCLVGCGDTEPTDGNGPTLPDIVLPSPEYYPEGPEDLGAGFVIVSDGIREASPFKIDKGSTNYGDLADNTGGIFADLDGDSKPEIVVGNLQCCFLSHSSSVFKYDESTGQVFYSAELSEQFEPGQGMANAIVDLDNDGSLDLFTKRSQQGVHWGLEEGGFSEGEPYPPFNDIPTPSHLGALQVVDFDHDGWLDLLLGDGHCEETAGTIIPLLQTGPQQLEARPDLFEGQKPASVPYAVLWAPIGDGLVFAAGRPCSDVEPNPGFFVFDGFDDAGYPRYRAEDITALESAYKEDVEVSYGPLPLASPMAAGVADLDNDGHLDFVTTLRTSYGIFQGSPDGELTEVSPRSKVTPVERPEENHFETPWGFALVDLDRDGREDWLIAHGNNGDPGGHNPDILKRTRVFWNATGFQFRELTEISGQVENLGNWRALAVGDLERDGDPDLIIGGTGLFPEVYRNEIEADRPSMGIQLRGHTSNHLGIGAILRIDSEDGYPTVTAMMNHVSNPISTSEPIVFVGTAKDNSLKRLEVEWPSGYVQEFSQIKGKGILTLEEPPLVTVTPPTRRAPADGQSTVLVEVRPHRPDGSMDPSMPVEIEIAAGSGSFSGPIEQTNAGYQRELKAPETVGSTVIAIKMGDTQLKVRPRIWWEQPR